MEKSNDTIKVIGALMLGVLAGTALGILFAPNKGSKTRRSLLNGAKDLGEDLTKKIKDEVNALRNKAEHLEGLADGKITELTQNIKQKVDTLKHQN